MIDMGAMTELSIFSGNSDDEDFVARVGRLCSGFMVNLARDSEIPPTSWEWRRTGPQHVELRLGDDAFATLLGKMVWT